MPSIQALKSEGKMSIKRKWHALYTKPRWEKKVNQLLLEKGFETYCPLNKVRRQWSDRMKTVEEPLFKSYVFVRVTEDDKTPVRMTNGVVNFVYWLGKPAVIKDREIETIKKFLNEHENISVESAELQVGQKVLIQSGVFMHSEGSVEKVMNKKILIHIKSLGINLVVNNSRDNIRLIG